MTPSCGSDVANQRMDQIVFARHPAGERKLDLGGSRVEGDMRETSVEALIKAPTAIALARVMLTQDERTNANESKLTTATN